jgi:hypothetical protein
MKGGARKRKPNKYMRKKYQIKDGDKWVNVSKAQEVQKGFLDYSLRDGTRGLAQAKNWRIAP